MKIKSKLISLVSIGEILITWAITRTLDYLVRLIARRLNLKIKTELVQKFRSVWMRLELYYVAGFQDDDLMLIEKMFPFLIKKMSFSKMVEMTLISHKRMHERRMLPTKSCRSCHIIIKNKDFFQKLVSNPDLYPPFKFAKK